MSWAAIDGVPSYRKPGLLLKSGLTYEPLLDTNRVQTAARLHIEADSATFALALARPAQVSFDQVQLSQAEPIPGVSLAPFVVTDSKEVFVFGDESSDHCARWDGPEPLSRYGLVDDIIGVFSNLDVRCLPLSDLGPTMRVGTLPRMFTHVVALGLLVDRKALGGTGSVIQIEGLALADSTKRSGVELPGSLVVRPVNVERSIAFRSTDTRDDESLRQVVVREFGTDSMVQLEASPAGVFEIDRDIFTSDIVQISMSDYGQEFYPVQGPWIDMRRLDTELRIDLAPAWEVTPGAPPESSRIGRPHRLSTWNGSTTMDSHEYRGLTFTNNLGRADRDRLMSNPNQCRRIAYLGGSWVEAIQTRVDQKPGIIAEGLLDSDGAGCHEVFTLGRDTFTVENHYANVVDLVESYGVKTLVFSISAIELCRMDDQVVLNRYGKALETPPRWRLIQDQIVEPVSRGAAIDIEVDANFDALEHCDFKPDTPHDEAVEKAIVAKLGQLRTIFESLAPDIEVRFVNVRDAYSGALGVANHISELCAAEGLACQPAEVPNELATPDGVDDHSPYLYRYRQDAHPNVRANQAIAHVLVAAARS